MNGLTFAQPAWFWGLLVLVPLIVVRLRAHWHSARLLPGLVAPRLASRLISGSCHRRRWIVFTFHCLAVTAILIALARPMLGYTEIETVTDARNLLIAIDTSRSMMAEDLPPNRLTRAKLAAKDIILSLPEDRVGLIAFAGRPFVQAPLTVDHEAILEAIDQLDTEIIPRGGTNLSAAASLALETFQEAELEQSALVIFSDGEALEGMDQVEKIRDEAKAAGMSILTVGVGSAEGAIIPEMDDNGVPIPGLFIKDDQGQVVRTRLVADALQSLSSGGGAYVHLGGNASLTRVVEQITEGLAASREESETRLRPIERFMWPLSAALTLLVLAHILPLFWLKPSPGLRPASTSARRSGAGMTTLFTILVFSAEPAFTRDSILNGYEAYENENFAEAIDAYEGALTERLTGADRSRLHMGIGAAAYRLGNYERAAEAYGRAIVEGNETLRSQAHYNLGNTLFRHGETALGSASTGDPDQLQPLPGKSTSVEDTIRAWEASIEHYETTLSLHPDNPRAAHNLELVKKRLEDLKNQQEEEQKKEEEQKEEQDEKDEKKEDEKDEKEQEKNGKDEPKNGGGDGKPDEQQEEEPGKEDPQNPSEKEPKEEPSSQDPKDGDGEKSDPENPSDKTDPGEDSPGDQQPPQNPGQDPPPQPDAPQDGKLEADPSQAQPQNGESSGQPGQAGAEAAQKMNPATGYSPSEARQLLEALADETEVRPLVQPSRGEKFKNW